VPCARRRNTKGGTKGTCGGRARASRELLPERRPGCSSEVEKVTTEPVHSVLEVHVLNAGVGESIVVRLPNWRWRVVDCQPGPPGDSAGITGRPHPHTTWFRARVGGNQKDHSPSLANVRWWTACSRRSVQCNAWIGGPGDAPGEDNL